VAVGAAGTDDVVVVPAGASGRVAALLGPVVGSVVVARATAEPGVPVVSGTAVADNEASASEVGEEAVFAGAVAAAVGAGLEERLGAGASPLPSCARVTSWPSAAANP
jgi:hypothetical protein